MSNSVRKAENQTDIQGCASVDVAMGFEPSLEVLERAQSAGRLLIVEQDSEIVGYLRYGFAWDPEVVIIQMIRIKQDFRGMGFGKKLIQLLEEELKDLDTDQLLSSTDESNTASYKFHKALGFKECGSLDINTDGLMEIFFKKRIKN